jgi:hypothetical protein
MPEQQGWQKLFNPTILKQNLIACSVYLAAYEMLRTALIDTLRGFYCTDYSQFPKWPISEKYKTKVLSLHKSEMTACATWFLQNGALDDDDLLILRELADHRNQIAHETHLIVGSDQEVSILHLKLIYALTAKIDQWWIRNIEVPTNPDFDDKELTDEDYAQSHSMRMVIMSLMIEVAEGDDSRLAELYEGMSERMKDHHSNNNPQR